MNCVSAAESRATCSNCEEDVCRDNILEDIIREEILTSGYFGVTLTATKPKGEKIYIKNYRHNMIHGIIHGT